MLLKCFSKSDQMFQESKRIYQETPPAIPNAIAESPWYHDIEFLGIGDILKTLGGLTSILGNAGEGLGNLADAARKLSENFSNLIKLAGAGLEKGTIEAVDGIKQLVNWIKNHKEMQELLELDEYAQVQIKYLKDLTPTIYINRKTNDQRESLIPLTDYMGYEFRIAELNILLLQSKIFFEPIMDQLKFLSQEIDSRMRCEYDTRDARKRLEEEIDNYDELLNRGTLTDSEIKSQYEIQKALAQRSLKSFKSQCDLKKVELSIPQLQMTEFPVGSGNYLPRFLPDSNKKVKVDLEKMVRNLGAYAKRSERFLRTYTLEKAKYLYRQEVFKEGYPKLFEEANSELETYKNRLKDRINLAVKKGDAEFKKQTPPEPMYDVISNASQLRRSTVNTPPITSSDYLMLLRLGKMPETFEKFGCYVDDKVTTQNPDGKYNLYKVNTNTTLKYQFEFKPDGTVITAYPEDKEIRTLPAKADPNDKNAWNPPMP